MLGSVSACTATCENLCVSELCNIFYLVEPFTSEYFAAWTFNIFEFELEILIYLTVFRTAGDDVAEGRSNVPTLVHPA